MGMFNTYGETQLKVGDNLLLIEYKEGDKVTIPDGIYHGHYGFVVIKNGVFIGDYRCIFDNFGDVSIEAKDDE